VLLQAQIAHTSNELLRAEEAAEDAREHLEKCEAVERAALRALHNAVEAH
jgi:hypothetical protein